MTDATPPAADDDGPDGGGSSRGCVKGGLIAVGLMLALAVTLVGCLAFVTSQVTRQLPRRSGIAARGDYAISKVRCAFENGGVYVVGTIRNGSHRQQGFRLTYRFRSPDHRQLAVTSNYTGIIQSGEATRFDVVSGSPDDVAASTCDLIQVRYSNFAPQPN